MSGYFNVLVRVNFTTAKSSDLFVKMNDLLVK